MNNNDCYKFSKSSEIIIRRTASLEGRYNVKINIRRLMHCVGEQSQRDEVFQAVGITTFQAERNKPERTEKKSIKNEDIASVTLNNQQSYIHLNYCCFCSCTYFSCAKTKEE